MSHRGSCASDADSTRTGAACEEEPTDTCPPHPFDSELLNAAQLDALEGDGVLCPDNRPVEVVRPSRCYGDSPDAIVEQNAPTSDASTWQDAADGSAFSFTRRFIDEDGVVEAF